MASYNNTKAADRARCRADRQAELDAIEAGTWPRDLDDRMRWLNAPTNPYLSAAENQRIEREYAAKMCRKEIEYLDGVEDRIKSGELAGWEPSC